MTDVLREKYVQLMDAIEVLEDRLEALQKKNGDAAAVNELQTELAAKRNELARISDGCGKPHPQS